MAIFLFFLQNHKGTQIFFSKTIKFSNIFLKNYKILEFFHFFFEKRKKVKKFEKFSKSEKFENFWKNLRILYFWEKIGKKSKKLYLVERAIFAFLEAFFGGVPGVLEYFALKVFVAQKKCFKMHVWKLKNSAGNPFKNDPQKRLFFEFTFFLFLKIFLKFLKIFFKYFSQKL